MSWVAPTARGGHRRRRRVPAAHPLRAQRRRRARPHRLRHPAPGDPRRTSASTTRASSRSSRLIGGVSLVLQIPIAHYADRGPRVTLALLGAVVWSLFSFATGPRLDAVVPRRRPLRLGHRQGGGRPDPQLADRRLLPARRTGRRCTRSTAPPTPSARSSARCSPGSSRSTSSWRVPFFVFAIPTLIIVVLGLAREGAGARRARAPGHGRQRRGGDDRGGAAELRRGAGASAAASRRLRRIWWALPFLAAVAHRVRVAGQPLLRGGLRPRRASPRLRGRRGRAGAAHRADRRRADRHQAGGPRPRAHPALPRGAVVHRRRAASPASR